MHNDIRCLTRTILPTTILEKRMAKELSRRELFDLVWSKPMTKVAADLGVSDVAVHKICVKYRIP